MAGCGVFGGFSTGRPNRGAAARQGQSTFTPSQQHASRSRLAKNVRHFTPRAESEGNNVDDEVKAVVSKLEETSSLIANNSAFAQVFQQALQRQGLDALTRTQQLAKEKRPSPAEEVLIEALRQARRNLLRLEDQQKQVEFDLENQQKQFDRIQFALQRAQADRAYIRTLEKIRADQKEKIQDLESGRMD